MTNIAWPVLEELNGLDRARLVALLDGIAAMDFARLYFAGIQLGASPPYS